ncbi:hypothetical protein [Acidihalobacter prosperus]|uniref:Uncharacterized protein n=1 Tax=Acidihalobacter prosperus TaxID=160660 RepID=A0A1A6C6V3_9GAMM|nr:hypothetical protein [Acidihalobacter prosperus]OBS10275.1 hypothetical protein Thpro_021325 [Acidihalobacter prosperus]
MTSRLSGWIEGIAMALLVGLLWAGVSLTWLAIPLGLFLLPTFLEEDENEQGRKGKDNR